MLGNMDPGVPQINLLAVYVANGLGISLLLAVLYGRHKRLWDRSRDGMIFRWMCRICLLLCILDTGGFTLEGKQFPGARQVSIINRVVILLLAVILSYLWICYVNYKTLLNHRQTRTNCLLAAIPAAAIGLFSFANLFFPIFFWVNEANYYYRTAWFFLPWMVVYGYMVWGVFQSYCAQRRVDRRLFIPMLMFLAPICAGSLIQLFCYGISLVWPSVAVGLTYLYINLQSEQAYLDPLTRLYNRNYLLHYMNHITSWAKGKRQITGVMLDINDFKSINDTLGHTEGDAVLQAVGALLFRSAGNHAVIRYGGDEFVILLEDLLPDAVQATIDTIRQALQAYNLSRAPLPPVSFSMGIAKFDHTDMFQFFHDMDMRMYEQKHAFYLYKESPQTPSAICNDRENKDAFV